jgi:sterol desaturase/sphingolipid hydroxylase (fatty acid hydroxylase superfamily)
MKDKTTILNLLNKFSNDHKNISWKMKCAYSDGMGTTINQIKIIAQPGNRTIGIFTYITTNELGLLHLVELPIWVELILAILVLDFMAQYLVHYLLHKVKWMWKFHMIHHSDTNVDATTGTRHHPGDYVQREFFALFAIVITGAPFAFYMIYKVITIFF